MIYAVNFSDKEEGFNFEFMKTYSPVLAMKPLSSLFLGSSLILVREVFDICILDTNKSQYLKVVNCPLAYHTGYSFDDCLYITRTFRLD
jgi:hypothetical protein